MATAKEPRCVVLFHGRAATYRVQLPEVDSSSSLALSLNIKSGALSRGTERDRHSEEGAVGASGMTTHSQSCLVGYCLSPLVDSKLSVGGTKTQLALQCFARSLTQTRCLQNMLTEGSQPYSISLAYQGFSIKLGLLHDFKGKNFSVLKIKSGVSSFSISLFSHCLLFGGAGI